MKVKKICFSGKRKFVIVESDLDENIAPNQIMCKTLYTIISPGTETAMYNETHIGFKDPNNSYAKYPFYPGYLNVARVEKIGDAVKSFSIGKLIFTFETHCSAFIIDTAKPGTIAVPLPDDIDSMLAPLAGMATISNTANFMASASSGQLVSVLGMGIIGNFAAQIYRNTGVQAVGVDLDKYRLEVARECDFQTYQSEPGCNWIPDFHKTYGMPDIVVEATGNPDVIETALKLTGKLGKVILLGSPKETSVIDTYNLIHSKGVSLIGAHTTLLPNRKEVIAQVLKEIALKKLITKPLLTHKCHFTEAHDAFEEYVNGNTRRMATLLSWQ